MAKVLLVEDDEQLADSVRTALLFDHHSVEVAHDGETATHLLRLSEYDLIILDWGLPGQLTGIEVCRNYRSTGGKTPVIMLTGKSEVADKAAGLDSGADDYMPKPFHIKELSARVRALLRRPATYTGTILNAGSLSLDPIKHRAFKGEAPLSLLPKEFALLEFMMRHPNQVFTPEALLAHVWPSDTDATVAALRTTMKRLRAKIDPEGELLRTEHGVGYMLEV
jgi:DNA-binding response OmpR family regulator